METTIVLLKDLWLVALAFVVGVAEFLCRYLYMLDFQVLGRPMTWEWEILLGVCWGL